MSTAQSAKSAFMAGRKGHFEDCSEYLGRRIGSWTVIGTGFSRGQFRGQEFVARCVCGGYGRVTKTNLTKGQSTKCAKCKATENLGKANKSWRGYKDIPQHVFGIMCRAARARDLPVEISIEDLQAQWERQGGKCALTGLPIRIGSHATGRVASVDRIDNSRGYLKDNIQWVHKDVNLMKNKFDEEYFLEMCKRVVEHRAA